MWNWRLKIVKWHLSKRKTNIVKNIPSSLNPTTTEQTNKSQSKIIILPALIISIHFSIFFEDLKKKTLEICKWKIRDYQNICIQSQMQKLELCGANNAHFLTECSIGVSSKVFTKNNMLNSVWTMILFAFESSEFVFQ